MKKIQAVYTLILALIIFGEVCLLRQGKQKQMGLCQTRKLLHNKGNYQQNEKATYWTGEDIWKWEIQLGVNNQNTQITHTVQPQKSKKLDYRDRGLEWTFFSKKTYKQLSDTWKDAPHH